MSPDLPAAWIERLPETDRYITAWSPGCLCNFRPMWPHGQPTTWARGYSVVYHPKYDPLDWTETNSDETGNLMHPTSQSPFALTDEQVDTVLGHNDDPENLVNDVGNTAHRANRFYELAVVGPAFEQSSLLVVRRRVPASVRAVDRHNGHHTDQE